MILKRFQQECVFLESIRHPNIVQYLGVTRDPESRLPVLLMELLDESLTKMLERSQQSLAYCVQVDICHDIALAVAYLHSNDIIHRDLSSNNVLMIAGRRAKVSDFGMSKLAGAASSMTPLTTCPGTLAYMPPEALNEPPSYTKKLDCFSEGVIMIQVCTRLWPEPGPRMQTISDSRSPTGVAQVPVLEDKRRKNHIDMIDRGHGLLPIAMDCLCYLEKERPSSEELCQRLANLKETREYGESVELIKGLQEDPAKGQLVLGEWRDGGKLKAPFEMARGHAVVMMNVAYFMNFDGKGCLYDSLTKKWSVLPECPHMYGSLVIVQGLLTVIGGGRGLYHPYPESKLLSLRNKKWVERFPVMPTRRYSAAAVTTGQHLIVAGGQTGLSSYTNTVEVMDIQTLVWSAVTNLPHSIFWASATVCGDRLYLLGGFDKSDNSKSILACSLEKLLQSSSETLCDSVWQRITDVPVHRSTCAAVNGDLVAVGGRNERKETTAAIYKYNPTTDSWDLISYMPTGRYDCLVAFLPTNEMIVLGGYTPPIFAVTDKIEIATVTYLA